MFYIALWISKIIKKIIEIIAPQRGTAISGQIACKLCKEFIAKFKNIDPGNIIIVTGTNGKSTTINIMAHSLKLAGKQIATNIEGANMMGGVATVLIKNSTFLGTFNKEILLLEIDERSLPYVLKLLPAKHLCITNIQKDQVQRNGEPDYIYQKIKKAIKNDMILYLNNEDPRAKSLEEYSSQVIYYGIEKNQKSYEKNDFYDVTLPCPKCNHRIIFNYYNIDNIGNFACTSCDHKSEENTEFMAQNIDYQNSSFTCKDVVYTVPYAQAFFIYNFILSIALCTQFGIEESIFQQAFSSFKNISGRLETLKYKNKKIKYIRIKQENPETLQSALDYVSGDDKNKILLIGLEELVDFKPHYTNTFYFFDCNMDTLISSNVDKYICFSEAVAYDTANRLIYAGIEKEKISVLPTDDTEEILKELDKYDLDNCYLITWLKKYYEVINYIEKAEEDSDARIKYSMDVS
jgi:UDP-N-acetylmuramyl tripeptide synthase